MLTPGVSRRILYGPVLSKCHPPIAFKFLTLILLKASRLGKLTLPCDTERDWILSGIVRTQGGMGVNISLSCVIGKEGVKVLEIFAYVLNG